MNLSRRRLFALLAATSLTPVMAKAAPVLQATGERVNTWGAVLNPDFVAMDQEYAYMFDTYGYAYRWASDDRAWELISAPAPVSALEIHEMFVAAGAEVGRVDGICFIETPKDNPVLAGAIGHPFEAPITREQYDALDGIIPTRAEVGLPR